MQQTTSIVLKSKFQPRADWLIGRNLKNNVYFLGLSILLGLFFLFTGFMKISPYISKELHRDLVSCCLENEKLDFNGKILNFRFNWEAKCDFFLENVNALV